MVTGAAERGAAVGDRVMKLVEHQAVGRDIGLVDRAVVVAVERLAQDVVGLALQGVELFDGFDLARPAAIAATSLSRCRCSAAARRA